MRVGAPKGGRVHWFLFHLNKDIFKHYILEYDYSQHSYLLYRKVKTSLYDMFVVIRTSKHCWRLSYVCASEKRYVYLSCKTSRECAYELYRIYRDMCDSVGH